MIPHIICLLASIICIVEGHKVAVINERLKLINKPPIKTIELDYATFDCVNIYEQPAFDNPLLKNHKIQLEPNIQISNEKGRKRPPQPRSNEFSLSPGCPSGTVPIRRTTEEDVIRELSSIGDIKDYFYFPNSSAAHDELIHFATLSIYKKDTFFTGAEALVNIQQPRIDQGAASGAQIWLFNYPISGIVTAGISAGWFVDSQFYGDARPYFTASWVGEDGSGCFNIRCPGFVQVDQVNPLGFLLPSVSQYGGPLVDMKTRIYQDIVTKNWWLMAGDNSVKIGYWPKELFRNELDNGVDNLHMGGVVRATAINQLSPPMGSGVIELCHYGHTGYFSNIWFFQNGGTVPTLPTDEQTTFYETCRNGYRVFHSCAPTEDHRDYYFLYGGPPTICTS